MKLRACRSCRARKACLKSAEEALELAEEIGYPGDHEGVGRRRRTRHARRARSRRSSNRTSRRRRPRRAQRSLAPTCTSRSSSKRRGTSNFRCWPTSTGTSRVLGERECSIQRRHQKLIEEAPSPAVTANCAARDDRDSLRSAMAAVGYTNAGTVEFLMDETGKLYFIEVNARIQVEHPVTELVTGVDMVKAQIRIAGRYALPEILPIAGDVPRPRDRMPHQRRASGDVRAVAGQDHRLESAGRHRRSRGHGGVHRLRDSARTTIRWWRS